MPTEGQKLCIDSVVLEIARVFKEKIIDLVEPLCQQCNITEAEVLDSSQHADVLGTIATNKKDIDFLRRAFLQAEIFTDVFDNFGTRI